MKVYEKVVEIYPLILLDQEKDINKIFNETDDQLKQDSSYPLKKLKDCLKRTSLGEEDKEKILNIASEIYGASNLESSLIEDAPTDFDNLKQRLLAPNEFIKNGLQYLANEFPNGYRSQN